ncbi:hypothetical protein N436_02784 [Pseudomonas sp. RV120224-01b]|nr:hypothetical protein N428_02545 [Pseudomonas sp. RV120224-01c]PYG82300.1 hypothetical protein N436_02784 [Pseudomonas sp. RV120224-01b]
MDFQHLLEKYQLAAGVLETINAYMQIKGLSLRQGTIIHASSSTKAQRTSFVPMRAISGLRIDLSMCKAHY